MLIWMGEYEKAKEWLQVGGSSQAPILHAIFLYNSGALGLREGRLDEAEQFLKQAAGATKLNRLDPINIPLYETCADLLWRQSHLNRSTQLFGAIDRYRRQAGMPRHPRYRPYYDQIQESLRQQLGEDGFEREFAFGQAQGISRAIDELEEYWEGIAGMPGVVSHCLKK